MRAALVALAILAVSPASAEMVAVYTPFTQEACRRLQQRDPNVIVRRCPGAAGLALHTVHEEATEAVFVGDPRATRTWRSIEIGPDDRPGERIEWRVRREGGRDTATAFILRVTFTGAAGRQVQGGVLAVSKIEGNRSCLMALVPAGSADANVRARELADGMVTTFRCGQPVRE